MFSCCETISKVSVSREASRPFKGIFLSSVGATGLFLKKDHGLTELTVLQNIKQEGLIIFMETLLQKLQRIHCREHGCDAV
ncbi:hypothetical protein DNHGIG_11290 [Collibacillus ludicampi]|uniref:Uncharacterized protein n=1 Tax=Collibacillus ludicampi TaxID=2771369 RepID=A0AAV4LCM7_9BACL|nr:hypothetical protein DNHGIG_11290 [Collibacillus ludicampi]